MRERLLTKYQLIDGGGFKQIKTDTGLTRAQAQVSTELHLSNCTQLVPFIYSSTGLYPQTENLHGL